MSVCVWLRQSFLLFQDAIQLEIERIQIKKEREQKFFFTEI